MEPSTPGPIPTVPPVGPAPDRRSTVTPITVASTRVRRRRRARRLWAVALGALTLATALALGATVIGNGDAAPGPTVVGETIEVGVGS